MSDVFMAVVALVSVWLLVSGTREIVHDRRVRRLLSEPWCEPSPGTRSGGR